MGGEDLASFNVRKAHAGECFTVNGEVGRAGLGCGDGDPHQLIKLLSNFAGEALARARASFKPTKRRLKMQDFCQKAGCGESLGGAPKFMRGIAQGSFPIGKLRSRAR